MKIEELAARAEIHDVLLRYCRGLDRLDMSLVRGAFHPDAYIHFPESLHIGGVEGFFQFLEKEMPRFNRTMHNLGNSLIEFDGSRTAYVETYLNADHEGTDQHQWKNEKVRLWARYLDRFEERNGRWAIAERKMLVEWMYRYPAEGWFDDHPDASVDTRGSGDWTVRTVAGFDGTPKVPTEKA